MNTSPAAASSAAKPLEPRLLKGTQADYTPAPAFPGRNPSGLLPVGPNVLIRIDTCSAATAGGVLLNDDFIDRMDMASESGVIYAVGATAWKGYGDDEKPRVGDRVYFTRYSGITGPGRDGGKYRVMDDTCIACRIELGDGELPPILGQG